MTRKSLLKLVGILPVLVLAGCGGIAQINMNPETRSTKFTVERDFDSAFKRTVETFGVLGGGITSQDARAGTVAATVHNAVNMTVSLNAVAPARTEVSVWGSTIPGKVVVGVFTEVDDFQRIYMEGKP